MKARVAPDQRLKLPPVKRRALLVRPSWTIFTWALGGYQDQLPLRPSPPSLGLGSSCSSVVARSRLSIRPGAPWPLTWSRSHTDWAAAGLGGIGVVLSTAGP